MGARNAARRSSAREYASCALLHRGLNTPQHRAQMKSAALTVDREEYPTGLGPLRHRAADLSAPPRGTLPPWRNAPTFARAHQWQPSPEGRSEPRGLPPRPTSIGQRHALCGLFRAIQMSRSHSVLPRPRGRPTKRPSVAAFPHAGAVVIWRQRSGSPSVGFAKPGPGYSSFPRWSRRRFSSGCALCRF